MNRLNYFNPFSKENSNEDQLTRAYLALLRFSNNAFYTFFDYCRNKHIIEKKENALSITDYLKTGWVIETQKGNPEIATGFLLSVLITDENIKNRLNIKPSERNARYDGVITFGNDLTIIIENKPRSYNVWFDQLNPSKENLSEDTVIYKNSVVLEWKEIIKQLNVLLSNSFVNGGEKLLIEDFLSYIDEEFGFLNPYDNFALCKSNEELICRRINNILKSIAIDETIVQYHQDWGYYIQTPYDQIKKLGLIYKYNDNDWWLELQLNFGDTQTQAKAFYNSTPDIEKLIDDWEVYLNFHFSYRSSNLAWFESDIDKNEYINYWIKNMDEIYQHKKGEIRRLITKLENAKIIRNTEKSKKDMGVKFYKTAVPALNICPGLSLIYCITSDVAEKLDTDGELGNLLIDKITEGLKIINLNARKLVKQKNET
jgi:hypothetical protein